jgi:hypothetical protein
MNVANIAPGEASPTRYSKQNLFFPRLDYHINSKNDAFIDFNFADFDSTNGYSAAPTFSNSSPTTNGPTSYHERFLVGGLTTVISNSAVNQPPDPAWLPAWSPSACPMRCRASRSRMSIAFS